MKYTPDTMRREAGVYQLNDVVVFPSYSLERHIRRTQKNAAEKIVAHPEVAILIPPQIRELMMRIPEVGLDALYEDYRKGKYSIEDTQNSPAWMSILDADSQIYIRSRFVMQEAFEHPTVIPSFQFHGIGYVIDDDGMTIEICRALDSWRLQHVRQLAFLHDPLTKKSVKHPSLIFPHDRLTHSFDVSVVANLIIGNNPCLEGIAKEIRAAGIMHDILTPAGGDTTKGIDRDGFDEDANFPELYSRRGWKEFQERHHVHEERLASIVLGKGIGGRVLDLADKSSYMARDLLAFLIRGEINGKREYTQMFYAMKKLADENPTICALWAHARVVGDNLVIDDEEALYQFLKLRAFLFKGLYYNPRSRMVEYIVAQKILGWAYFNGLVTREELLEWTDDQLERYIERLTGFHLSFSTVDQAEIETFSDLSSALKREADLKKDPGLLVVVDDFVSQTKDGTRSFCVERKGKAVHFADACPAQAKHIAKLVEVKGNAVRVYKLSVQDLKIRPNIARELRLFEFQWLQKKLQHQKKN